MSDRELLEKAARAYWGDEVDDVMSFHWDEEEQAICYIHADNQDHNGNDTELLWIPLDDLGDAMRIAVKLGISVEPYPYYSHPKHSVVCKQRRRSDQLREHNPTEVIELYGDDPGAATCMAIVRATAAIHDAKGQHDQN
ncbi:MAG TPA: hypothetical protein VFM33_13920 [Aquabacterium sp.]|nr:hypothetical protein [Aquabacterium sp.]